MNLCRVVDVVAKNKDKFDKWLEKNIKKIEEYGKFVE